jgi:hypothetical protein
MKDKGKAKETQQSPSPPPILNVADKEIAGQWTDRHATNGVYDADLAFKAILDPKGKNDPLTKADKSLIRARPLSVMHEIEAAYLEFQERKKQQQLPTEPPPPPPQQKDEGLKELLKHADSHPDASDFDTAFEKRQQQQNNGKEPDLTLLDETLLKITSVHTTYTDFLTAQRHDLVTELENTRLNLPGTSVPTTSSSAVSRSRGASSGLTGCWILE